MAYSILVATTHTPFGELIRVSLEETRRYRVQVVESGSDVAWQLESSQSLLDGSRYVVAIVDGELQDLPVDLLTEQAAQGLKLFLVPPSNGHSPDGLANIPLAGTVKRPFYLPELLDMVARAVEDAPAGMISAPPSQSWPQEAALQPQTGPGPDAPPTQIQAAVTLPDRRTASKFTEDIQQEFTRLLQNTSALCGLWMARGREPYQACAGELEAALSPVPSDEAAAPRQAPGAPVVLGILSEHLLRYWDKTERGDLIRYVRLPEAETECQLYMTTLPDDEVLALVFTGDTPLSKIRSQAGKLVKALAELKTPEPPLPEESAAQGNGVLPEDRWFVEETASPLQAVPESELTSDPQLEAQLQELDLAALLGAIPTPNPQEGVVEAVEPVWMPADSSTRLPLPWDVPVEEDTQPVVVNGEEPAGAVQNTALLELEEPPSDPLEDTHPHVLTPPTSLNQLEPEAPGMSQIYYTCVLIPRLPQHYLTREIGDRVSQWVQQLCLAFDWRLEGIAIRPEYLQWMVQVAPSVSPGSLVKVIRQRTSFYLFNAFERLREENPSDDFWASGYLIISGAQPPAAKLLREYIRETRRRQGAAPLPSPDRNGGALKSGKPKELEPTKNRE